MDLNRSARFRSASYIRSPEIPPMTTKRGGGRGGFGDVSEESSGMDRLGYGLDRI